MKSGEARLKIILEKYGSQLMLRRLAAQSPLVPPEGLIGSPVMLIGEAPGAEEVRQLRPFVGPAGAVLDRALKRAELIRDWSWITNTVLYRPPGNRTPYPFEIACSRARLDAEVDLVRPDYIILLGATAWNAIPVGAGSYAQARGGWYRHMIAGHKCEILVTWHPSAAFHDSRVSDEIDAHLRTIHEP